MCNTALPAWEPATKAQPTRGAWGLPARSQFFYRREEHKDTGHTNIRMYTGHAMLPAFLLLLLLLLLLR
jgi:hypothetical protein